jgi:hypothetical protein
MVEQTHKKVPLIIEITYDNYPTIKITRDSLRDFDTIIEELSQTKPQIEYDEKAKIFGIKMKDLKTYFDNKKTTLQDLINDINTAISTHKLKQLDNGQNSINSKDKNQIPEEYRGGVNDKKNNLLRKAFNRIMNKKKQPACNDTQSSKFNLKQYLIIHNSSELNKKIMEELEKCFEFLTKILHEYCKQMVWDHVTSVPTSTLFQKEEKQQTPSTTTTNKLLNSTITPTHITTATPSTPTTSTSTPTTSTPTTTSTSTPTATPPATTTPSTTTTPTTTTPPQYANKFEAMAATIKGLNLQKGGALKSKKKINKINKINKISKKQKRIIKNKISRKSNSRYMRVSKKN